MGAKTIITDKGDVIYEIEDEEGSAKKVTAQEALKEIYKYMHGEFTKHSILLKKCLLHLTLRELGNLNGKCTQKLDINKANLIYY